MPYVPVAQLKKQESGYIPVAQLRGEEPKEKPDLSEIKLNTDLFGAPSTPPTTEFGTLDIAKTVGQGLARQWAASGAKIAAETKLATDDKIDPKSFFGVSPNARALGVAVFGKEEPFNATSEDVEFLETFGIEKEATEKAGGALTILLTALDVTPPGKAFKGVAGLIRALRIAKKADEVVDIMKSVGFADDIIDSYKDIFVATRKTKEVKEALEAAVKLQSSTTGKGYRPVAEFLREGAEVAPRIAPKISPDLEPLAQEARKIADYELNVVYPQKAKEMAELQQRIKNLRLSPKMADQKAATALDRQAKILDEEIYQLGKSKPQAGLEPLAIEAKKYKSAEEFVRKAETESINLPVKKIGGLEPQPAPFPKTKQAITEPVEVVLTEQGDYILEAGNHRVHQALFNGDATIPAKIRFEKGAKSQLTDFYNQVKEVELP
ncbi:MAG: hypothetical protein AAB875_03320, partial [Patescibacteria group bacterium]